MNKIVAISDVHIKRPGDEADCLLSFFFSNPKVKSADYIILLGDIFDLMCGPHEQYLELYNHHFEALLEMQKNGKKIYFFEGNHDVHLKKLFNKIWKDDEVVISQSPIVELIDGKKYYFSHGDEYDLDNHAYHRYISFIRSVPMKFFADHIMPYELLCFLGEKASNISRKKGSKKFDVESVRSKFRNGVVQKTQGKFDFILGGHSHVKDEFKIPGSNSIYVNNGYALQSKTFISIEDHNLQFLPLA